MGYNYQDAPMESQQEYFGIHTDNKETLQNALKRIEELEAQIEKMKMCCNCRKWRECGEQLDYVSYPCFQHNCDDVCPIWELWERR